MDATTKGQVFGDAGFSNLAARYYLEVNPATVPAALDRQAARYDRKEARDAIIRRLLLLDDEYFSRYCTALYTGRALADTAAETVNTSITAAATFLTPGNATRALTAIASGLSGLKLSTDKNLFLQQTAPALVAKMEAQRSVVDTHIQQFLHEDVATYPLEEGLRDFVKYYQAGTLLSAASGLSADATVQHEEADQQLQTTKLRRSSVSAILLPSRGLTLTKVVPPSGSASIPYSEPPLPGVDGGGVPKVVGPSHPSTSSPSTEPEPVFTDANLKARNDALKAAFQGMTPELAKSKLASAPGGAIVLPGTEIETLAKNVLGRTDLKLQPGLNPTTQALQSLTHYRKAATTDPTLQVLEKAYQFFHLIPST